MNLLELPGATFPEGVFAATTTRQGGVSRGEFSTLNVALHVGDDEASVIANRDLMKTRLDLPSEPLWLNQVHASRIALSGDADGSYTRKRGQVLCIQTADCLPVLIWNHEGTEIAAVHGGWQGLDSGVIGNALAEFESGELSAWIGPHIRSCHYEVDARLYDKFIVYEHALFSGRDQDHWQLDLSAVAATQLEEWGVRRIYQSADCTACDRENYFSYRRDGRCGRMASLIWMV